MICGAELSLISLELHFPLERKNARDHIFLIEKKPKISMPSCFDSRET